MIIGGRGDTYLVFLPGFLAGGESYRGLLAPLVPGGVTVEVPQLYRRGPAALLGRHPVAEEAAAAARIVRRASARPGIRRVFLAGHSRGGQAAWLASGLLAGQGMPAGLILLDPVDGHGRRPTGREATANPAGFTCPALIIGAGVGGPCAPESVNHHAFADATPAAAYALVPGLGHADILGGRARSIGRRLCGGGPDPGAARGICTALMTTFLGIGADHQPAEGVDWLRRP